MKTANQDTGVIVYSKGEFLCGQCYTLCSWTQIFLTFELRFKGCIHKLLVQIITEKFGAEFWAQDVFHYEHTYPIPIKQPVSMYKFVLPYSRVCKWATKWEKEQFTQNAVWRVCFEAVPCLTCSMSGNEPSNWLIGVSLVWLTAALFQQFYIDASPWEWPLSFLSLCLIKAFY